MSRSGPQRGRQGKSGETRRIVIRCAADRRETMIRKLETGDYLLERDAETLPPNRLQPRDYQAQARHEANKQAVFRKP
jgi:hypothetical protein